MKKKDKCSVCSAPSVFYEPRYGYHTCKKHKDLKPIQIHEAHLAVNNLGGMTVKKFYINWSIKL